MHSTDLEVVTQFSDALDRDDFETALKLMSRNCTFVSTRDTVSGGVAVCEMYERNSRRARSLFRDVRYHSMLDQRLADGGYRVQVVDQLYSDDDLCEYRSMQVIYLSPERLVSRIVWEQIPGQRESLEGFCEKHGVDLK